MKPVIAIVLAWLMGPSAHQVAPASVAAPTPVEQPAGDQMPVDAMAASTAHPFWLLDRDEVARFDRLSICEAGGDWHINTGNGYFGGAQFSLTSWRGVGGEGLPSDASREEQIWRGHLLQEMQGWGAWPGCARKFGWLN